MELFDLMFGWDMTIGAKPKETTMKKRKIRELLATILDKLTQLEADNGGRMTLEQANELRAQIAATNKKAREIELLLERRTREVTNLERRLEETRQDRDNWQRECEKYVLGAKPVG